MNANSPIGMFDSGSGGISVLREAVKMLPNEDFIYYGDSLNAPYGTKSEAQVLDLAENAMRFLLEKDVKAIVIACNTATAAAARTLREKYPIPIIGMEPALKPASEMQKNGVILVLATPGTLKSEKYALLSEKYGSHSIPLPCPGLMEFAERGECDSEALDEYLDALFAPYRDTAIDAAVLGCTHYVFLKRAIQKHLPASCAVIDGNEGTVRQLIRRLQVEDLLCKSDKKGIISMFSSGNDDSLSIFHNLFEIRT